MCWTKRDEQELDDPRPHPDLNIELSRPQIQESLNIDIGFDEDIAECSKLIEGEVVITIMQNSEADVEAEEEDKDEEVAADQPDTTTEDAREAVTELNNNKARLCSRWCDTPHIVKNYWLLLGQAAADFKIWQ